MSGAYEVTETLNGCHDKHPTYPLLQGDILIEQKDGTFFKTAPGLGIMGFALTPEQRSTLVRHVKTPRVTMVEGGLSGYADYLFGTESGE